MTNYGIRGSQVGIPVDLAADYQKTIDERWPIVEFLYLGVQTVKYVMPAGPTVVYVPIYQHNLGYYPGFFFKNINTAISNATSSPFIGTDILADQNNIYIEVFKSASDTPTITAKFFLGVIDRDISQTFQSTIDTPLAAHSHNPSDYGVKIQPHPNGPGMDQLDKTAFSLNSNAKPMAIQMHGTKAVETTGTYTGQLLLQHNLGIPPVFYVAKYFQNNTSNADPFNGKTLVTSLTSGSGIAFSDGTFLRIRGAQATLAGNYLYIILKDPIDVAL